MKFNEYQRLASRTALDRVGFTLTPEEISIIWNASGLAGEAGEVSELALLKCLTGTAPDRETLKKELGDVLWYLAALAGNFGFYLSEILNKGTMQREEGLHGLREVGFHGCAIGLATESGKVLDLLKKGIFHRQGIDTPIFRQKVLNGLGGVLWYVTALGLSAGLTFEEIAKANIEKLAQRYPEGFTPEASAARLDVAIGAVEGKGFTHLRELLAQLPECPDCGSALRVGDKVTGTLVQISGALFGTITQVATWEDITEKYPDPSNIVDRAMRSNYPAGYVTLTCINPATGQETSQNLPIGNPLQTELRKLIEVPRVDLPSEQGLGGL